MITEHLKFRAFYSPDVENKPVGRMVYSKVQWPNDGYALGVWLQDLEVFGPGSVKIMQFTGLCTEKGKKEIWEGDVVKRNGHFYKVVFKDGAFCLAAKKAAPIDQLTTMFHGSYLANFLSDLEVVGNVYENPDLMAQA